MKYQWSDKPPKGVPGVAAVKSDVWPKPDSKTLKYTQIGKLLVAIGQVKISGRWEVYIYELFIAVPDNRSLHHRMRHKWMAKSRRKGTHRPGYTNYKNAYRSIPQHVSMPGGPIR